MATVIQVDGTERQVVLSKKTHEKMEQIQKYVGGYYTPITLKDGKIMLVKLDGMEA